LKTPVYVVCLLLAVEMALRFQQSVGPLYDLEFKKALSVRTSDVVNHQPAIGGGYDQDGIRTIPAQAKEQGGAAFKVLFMGDSFMQGHNAEENIPVDIWNYYRTQQMPREAMCFLNAGYWSYSPLIYIAQFKVLHPKLKPDFVVIDIDETDLGDDFLRYRHLAYRDDQQKVIGVKPTPFIYAHLSEIARIKNQPSTLERKF
jgi:hypothetical protein